MTQCDGLSVMHETVYENRFGYTEELVRMGAEIQLFRLNGASGQNRATGLVVDGGQLSSFGEGPDGELYVLSLAGGVYHIEAA